MLHRFFQWTHRSRPPWRYALFAVILASPSIFCGFSIDDFAHIAVLKGVPLFSDAAQPSLDIFDFADGDPERMRRVMDLGMWPWWTLPELRTAFWRPVTALTHAADHYFWPSWPWLMHLQSLGWMGAAVAMATLCYRRFAATPAAASVAALLFAASHVHIIPAGWLANRNAEIALFWGLLTLWLHARGRSGALPATLLAPVTLLVAVLSNEGGIATCGYLFAFACFLDPAHWRSRILSLAPYAAVVVTWRVVYSHLGYGAYGSPAYLDPGANPAHFALAAAERLPVLLSALFLGPPGEVYFVLPPLLRFAFILWSIAVVGIFFALVLPLLRRPDSRFFVLGMGLAALPACATLPADRLLLYTAFGGLGILAQFLTATIPGLKPRRHLPGKRAVAAAAMVLLVLHGLLSPIRLATGIPVFHALMENVERHAYNTDFDESISDKTVIFTNAATMFHTAYFPMLRSMADLPAPARIRSIAPNSIGRTPMQVLRVDAHTLRVTPKHGYPIVLLRDMAHALRPGDRVRLAGMEVAVRSVNARGMPAEVDFLFDVALEDPALLWVALVGDAYEQIAPPSIGEELTWFTAPIVSLGD